ncbi:MAG: glycosyltransferase family 2 protein [Deltaproteobacteria bacterium]|jgi:glycosyltransferase involved in cell wall biosynthesis|nr:glycosyltransferase family 2 protein [Deltaproteobacteria bacterium]
MEEVGKKFISIVTACYNEAENIELLHERLTNVMLSMPRYDYEIICIDNKSTDGTRDKILTICAKDPKFKAIFNVRNFGHIRSPWHALLQAKGEAVVFLCSDLEDPPELIPRMIEKWEEGYKLAMAVRESSDEKGLYPILRNVFYKVLDKFSDVRQITGLTGFGLYDQEVIKVFRQLDDPYPYARGLIAELGWEVARIPFHKEVRKSGKTKNSFFTYFDMSLLALVNHSKVPLRFAIFTGTGVSVLSILVAIYYLARKLLFWDQFQAGVAPALIGIFFLLGVLFMVVGIVGEYVGLIVTHVIHRPLVIEESRFNFRPGVFPEPAETADPEGPVEPEGPPEPQSAEKPDENEGRDGSGPS